MMNKKVKNFLGQFDSNFQNHIVEFAKRLTAISKEYEVIILLARKAACLADSFDDLGLSQFHCIITSDRILDMNIDWLEGKKIAVVDDALISGTTIYRALEKLSSIKIEKVDVFVLSIDQDWWSPELVAPKEPYLKLNSKQTSIICSNIVNAISVIPRPYTIDYPLFKKIRIQEKDFQDLSNSAEWITFESTSARVEKYDIINLTITPSEVKAIEYFTIVGLPYCRDTLLKLRLYAIKTEDVYWCQVLPIVILQEETKETIELLFNHILSSTNNADLDKYFTSDTEENTLKGKLRLIQYHLACRLGTLWHNDIVTFIDRNIIFQQDFRNLNFLFPPPISDEIKTLAANESVNFNKIQITCNDSLAEKADTKVEDFDEHLAIYELTKPFLELYEKKELDARRKVKELGKEVFENKEYNELINRLNNGFSLNDLKSEVKHYSKEYNLNKLISYFLDIYIDRGAVVPITCFNNGKVYRAFRHGEDVEFAENELRLCTSMLNNITKEYGVNGLPHTLVEKALVLFIRIGVNKGFLTISSYPMGDYRSVGIRYYLHGAVVGQSDTKIYKINYNETLTRILEEAGHIKRESFNEPYEIISKPETGMDINGLNVANQLGLVLGNLFKVGDNKIELDDLMLMATCTYPIDTIGALAAEIQIFQSFYHYENAHFFNEFKNNSQDKFKKIRSKNAFTALNSGSWKFENYIKGNIWETIKKINDLFDNPLYAEVWKGFWPFSGAETSVEKTSSYLSNLVNQLADWLLSVRFFIHLIEISLSKDFSEFQESKSKKGLTDILNIYEKHLQKNYNYYLNIYQKTCERYENSTLKKEELYNFSKQKINEKFHFARQLLSEVDALSNSFGKAEKIAYYDHVLLVDFKSFNLPIKQILNTFYQILNRIKIEAKRKDITYIFSIPKEFTSIQTGIWLCSQGKNSRRWLIHFARVLLNELEEKANLKFTFFFHLGYFHIVKKTTSNQYYAPLFWDIAKELLKKKFQLKPTNELIYFTQSVNDINPIENELFNEIPQIISTGDNKSVKINKPYNLGFSSNHFIVKSSKIKNLMDVGIITIVTPELKAVTDYFTDNESYFKKDGALSSRKYHFGKLTNNYGQELTVVANQAIEQGNRSVISAYNAISEEFNPQIIVLLGIGGSIHKDPNVCDVVIADSTYYYDKRAETEEGIKRRIDPYKLNAWTKSLLANFQHELGEEEPIFQAAVNSISSSFKLFIGPIGTGEAVVKFKDSDVRKWLLSVNDKTLALETEAGGVTQQFYEDELSYSKRAKGIFIIRGISDKADVEKDDKYRLASAKNAVTVLIELLKTIEFPE